MGKKYNYYDTPYNHPEAVKYRNWENIILIFGIGVITTLLVLYYLFGNPQASTSPQEEIPAVVVAEHNKPSCKPANMIDVRERDRLIQLLALSNDLPIADVMVNELGTVCYKQNGEPVYDIQTDIMVTVDKIPAAIMTDYDALGDHVAQIVAVMMQVTAENPRQVTVRFLTDDTYLEWSHSYTMTNAFIQGMSGEPLWFWVEPEY